MWIVVAIVLIFAMAIGIYLYSGLREFNIANDEINSLESSGQLRVDNYLNGSESQNRSTGILGGVLANQEIVWAWSKQGPKIFRTDNETIFTVWSACSTEIKQKMVNGDPVMLASKIYPNMDELNKQVGRGDYIEVLVAGEGEKVAPGRAREVIVHDWWVFLPPEMGVQCAR